MTAPTRRDAIRFDFFSGSGPVLYGAFVEQRELLTTAFRLLRSRSNSIGV